MSSTSDSRAPAGMWAVVVLLGASVLINYIDRGNVAVASPQLKEELHLSASQLGLLFAAFYWTYTALQFASGWLVDTIDASLVIAAGFLVWSTAIALTGFVHGIVLLFVMRLLLGVGEAVAFPCYSKILAMHVPEQFRGMANGIIIGGTHGGPAVGTFAAGLLMARYGWRPVFIGIGLLSLLWLPLWARWRPRGSAGPATHAAGPGAARIVRQRSFWGASAGHFAGNYLFYFLVTWMPLYLVRERHLSLSSMATTAGTLYALDAIASLATGWLADFYLRRGRSLTFVRKTAMAIGCLLAPIGLAGGVLAGPNTYLYWLAIAAVGCGVEGSGTFAFAQTLAGPEAAGLWTGMQNGLANLSGAVGLAITGFVVDATGHFAAAFAITAVVIVCGGLAWVFGVERVEPVAWEQRPPVIVLPTLSETA